MMCDIHNSITQINTQDHLVVVILIIIITIDANYHFLYLFAFFEQNRTVVVEYCVCMNTLINFVTNWIILKPSLYIINFVITIIIIAPSITLTEIENKSKPHACIRINIYAYTIYHHHHAGAYSMGAIIMA